MKKIFIPVLFIITACSAEEKNDTITETGSETNEQIETMEKKSIHQFKVKDIEGNDFELSSLKGKKIMVVNTASECGYTPQYAQLEELYQEYKDNNFTVIAFPANNFGGQEPGTDEEIKSFCSKNYGVTFPLMSKISVKGDDMHPVYKFLTSKEENGVEDAEVKWNFHKFLIDEDGRYVRSLSHSTEPVNDTVIRWITQTSLDLN